MPHVRRETLARTFQVPGNGSATETVGIQPDSDPFRLEEVTLSVETAAIGDVTVQVLVGAERVAPSNEPVSPVTAPVDLAAEATIGPGGEVTISASKSTAGQAGVTVLLQGVRGEPE
jgi:hypothetical protein